MHADQMVDVQLHDDEWQVFAYGLVEWGGPASPNDKLAAAMGFTDLADFASHRQRLLAAVRSRSPLSRLDWSRLLVLTEIVFASDVVGAGRDWVTTTGLSDEDTIQLLRSIQRKLIGHATLAGGLS